MIFKRTFLLPFRFPRKTCLEKAWISLEKTLRKISSTGLHCSGAVHGERSGIELRGVDGSHPPVLWGLNGLNVCSGVFPSMRMQILGKSCFWSETPLFSDQNLQKETGNRSLKFCDFLDIFFFLQFCGAVVFVSILTSASFEKVRFFFYSFGFAIVSCFQQWTDNYEQFGVGFRACHLEVKKSNAQIPEKPTTVALKELHRPAKEIQWSTRQNGDVICS